MPEAPSYLLRNGQVHDGGDPPTTADVRIRHGLIQEIGPDLPHQGETEIDASGLIVAPGLIDLHVHAYAGVGRWSVEADDAGLRTGVTTMLDTGTAGALTYPAFERWVMPHAREDIFALLNIATIGCFQGYPDVMPDQIGELSYAGYLHAPSAVECLRRHPDRLLGLKVRLTSSLADYKERHERIGMEEMLRAAEATGTFGMVHHANSRIPLGELLTRLRPGDVYTHLYHPHPDGGFRTPESLDAMRRARDRGVLFDVGHGVGAFKWEVAERACGEHGFWPDTISTDLHAYNLHGPVWDLPTTMTKLLHLGMPLEGVIRAATHSPARAMRLDDHFGRLLPGRQADVTLLRLEEGAWDLPDVLGAMRTVKRRLMPMRTFKRGELYECGDR